MANYVKSNIYVSTELYELDSYDTVIILPHSFDGQSEIQIKILFIAFVSTYVVFESELACYRALRACSSYGASGYSIWYVEYPLLLMIFLNVKQG